MSKSVIFVCSARQYSYEGWDFEYPSYTGPWPLNKNGDPRERAGRQFYQMVKRFEKLTKEEQEKHRLGGGCETLHMPKVRKA